MSEIPFTTLLSAQIPEWIKHYIYVIRDRLPPLPGLSPRAIAAAVTAPCVAIHLLPPAAPASPAAGAKGACPHWQHPLSRLGSAALSQNNLIQGRSLTGRGGGHFQGMYSSCYFRPIE